MTQNKFWPLLEDPFQCDTMGSRLGLRPIFPLRLGKGLNPKSIAGSSWLDYSNGNSFIQGNSYLHLHGLILISVGEFYTKVLLRGVLAEFDNY